MQASCSAGTTACALALLAADAAFADCIIAGGNELAPRARSGSCPSAWASAWALLLIAPVSLACSLSGRACLDRSAAASLPSLDEAHIKVMASTSLSAL